MNLIFKNISLRLNNLVIVTAILLHIISLFIPGSQEYTLPNNQQSGNCHLVIDRSFTVQCAVFERDTKSKTDRGIERIKSNFGPIIAISQLNSEINFLCSLKPEAELLTGINRYNYGLTRGPPQS